MSVQNENAAPLSRSGSWVGLAILIVAAVGGAIIFYLKTYEHYREATGVAQIEIGDASFAVSDYRGLFHESWPQRLRGCFVLSDPQGALAAAPPAARPRPYSAPSWFECWKPAELDADLKAGLARAVVASSVDKGAYLQERVVAIYPDGRAYQWARQREKAE